MKCFIHIGITKTNIEYIQDFLSLHAYKLHKEGLLYTNFIINDKNLALALYEANHQDTLTNDYGLTTKQQLQDFQAAIISKLVTYVGLFDSQMLLISSEYIQSNITDINELIKLKKIVYSLGVKDIKIIIYLRNPTGILAALPYDFLKDGYSYNSLPIPYENNKFGRYIETICNHKSTIERFSQVFGEGNLIVKTFHKSSLKEGSILKDFLDILDLNIDFDHLIQKKEPRKISNLGFELLSRINKHIEVKPDERRKELRESLFNSFNEKFNANYSLSPELHQAYEQAFADSNEWVRQRFFPERETLFPILPAPEPVDLGFTAKELDNIANMLTDIWLRREKDLSEQVLF